MFRTPISLLIACYCIQNALPQEGRETNPTEVRINLEATFQTIKHFGASDAWRCYFVGKYWPEEKREVMAEWLFSKEFDESGNPKGIGLSLWRFNLGGGSMEQGDSSGISNEWRRGESFFSADQMHYDWNKQEGQQWFLKKAATYGVENLLLFVNAPPVQYSLNGKAYADKGLKGINLKAEYFDDYAQYLVDVAGHFNNINIPVNYISPVNEPQWAWDGGDQEGSPATNEEIYQLSKVLSGKLAQEQPDCNVILSEAGLMMFASDFRKESRGIWPFVWKFKPGADQVNYFFNRESEGYVGDFANMEYALAGHSYFSVWPPGRLLRTRSRLERTIQKVNPGMEYWSSEYCILQKNRDIGGGGGRDLGMPTALYVSRIIHYDLTIENSVSWQWWTAISQVDYKDGLIYLDYNGTYDSQKLKYDGEVHHSKLLWAFGNYSRFIRPGMQRVEVEYLQKKPERYKAKNLMISAFKDEESLVIVAVNYAASDQQLELNVPDLNICGPVTTYVTSPSKDLQKVVMERDELTLEGRSVTTLILKL